jgi:hypothetical protein
MVAVDKYGIIFLKDSPDLNYNQILLVKYYPKGPNDDDFRETLTKKVCFAQKTPEYAYLFTKDTTLSIEEGISLLAKMEDAVYFQNWNNPTKNRYSIKSFIKFCMELI